MDAICIPALTKIAVAGIMPICEIRKKSLTLKLVNPNTKLITKKGNTGFNRKKNK